MNYFEHMCSMAGYQAKTTFWDDFTIADVFGKEAIEDTYERAFTEWKSNYEFLTEFVLVLNWKCWEHYEKGDTETSEIYSNLYYKADGYALDNLKDNELDYYIRTTN